MSEEARFVTADNIFQGEDKQIRLYVVDAAGNPINISGYALEWVLSTQPFSSGDIVLTKSGGSITVADGIDENGVATGGTNDMAIIALADTDTIDAGAVVIPAGTYYHELWKADAGDEQVLAFGDFVLRPSRRR